jgi:hypothetical protein
MDTIEQQIYASLALPGLKPGHHTHAVTPGLDAAAIEQHEQICNQWGEYEPGADFTRALVQVPLWNQDPPPGNPSHYAVIQITYQGRDAGGRPGALLRHIVRIPAEMYAALDFNPFHLGRRCELLKAWTPETPFPPMEFPSDPTGAEDLRAIFPERYPMLRAMLTRLLSEGRLHLPSASDSPAAEEVFGQLMELAPVARRRWLSLATFAYRNAENFAVAAMRQDEASFRRSLQMVQDMRPPQLPPDATGYVNDLFAALERRDWAHATGLVRRSEVGSLAAATAAAGAAAPHPAGGVLREGAGEGVGAAALPFQHRPAGVPPPAPPLPPSSRRSRRSRSGLVIVAVSVLVTGALVGVLLSRSARQESGNVQSGERLRRASAKTLAQLVDEHEGILSQMLAQGARDFDLTEAMKSALTTLGERASAALDTECPALEEQLVKAAKSARGDESLKAVAASLQEAAQTAAESVVRLQGLQKLLSAGSLDQLRAAYNAQERRLHVPSAEGKENDPVTGTAVARAHALQRAADAAGKLAATRGGDGFTRAARALLAAADGFPERCAAPATLAQIAEGAAAASDLMDAEQRAGLSALALAVPYRAAALSEGDLAERVKKAQAAAARLRDGGRPVPGRLAQADAFYAAARAVAGGAAGKGEALLAAAVALCPANAAASPCTVADYAAHVARWKLEAWRAIGGPQTGAAKSVYARLGDAALPAPSQEALARMIDVLGQIEAAPSPAPPAVAAAMQGARGALGQGFYGDLCSAWLARNQHQAQSHQAVFRDVYGKLRGAVGQLRGASDATCAAALNNVAALVRQLSAIDLGQLEGDTREKARVAAARELVAAFGRPFPIPLQQIEVHLLSVADYSGTRRQVARPRITVSRVAGGSATELISVLAPPMLAAPGTGFATARVDAGGTLAVGPQDRLLIQGREENKGMVWFHLYVDPPRDGHVATSLLGTLTARVAPETARQIAASSAALPPPSSGGSDVATLQFEFKPRWWTELAAALPELP